MTSLNALMIAPATPSGGGGGGFNNTFQGAWVQDDAGNVYWQEVETDSQGVKTYIYYDQPGGNVVTPTGDLGPIDESSIQVIKRGDDINGDGSLVVTFYRVNIYEDDGAILSSQPQTAAGAPYTVQGTEIDPQNEIEALLVQGNANTASAITELASIQTATTATASSTDSINERVAGSFINFNFDEVDLTYVASGAAAGEIETATYSLASIVQGTVTISYDSLTGNITNATRA